LVADVAPGGPGASLAHARRRIVVLSDGEDSDWVRMPSARVDPIALTQFLINNKIVIDGNAPYGRSANSRAALCSGRGRERMAFAFRADICLKNRWDQSCVFISIGIRIIQNRWEKYFLSL
jgi:hypothetical protein